MKDPEQIYVVVPAYNEQQTIHAVVSELDALGYPVIVVDDGSAQELLQQAFPARTQVIRHRVNLGQGAALQTGLEYALAQGAQYVATFDADGQHPAAAIGEMLELQKQTGVDVILGSRFLVPGKTGVPARRAFTLRLARWVNFLFTGLMLTDAHNGLRLFTAKAARCIRMRENRMAHATELLSLIRRHGLSYREMPVTIRYTEYSMAKGQSFWSSFRIVFDLLLSKIFR